MEQNNIILPIKKPYLNWVAFSFGILSLLTAFPLWEGGLIELFDFSLIDAVTDILGIRGLYLYSFAAEINPLLIFIPGTISIIIASICLRKKIGKKSISLISITLSGIIILVLIVLILDFLLGDTYIGI